MYTKSLVNYSRFEVDVVEIGCVPLGGEFPIRLQSMTNTLTQDISATEEQIIRIIEKGADYVRVTTPTLADVEALVQVSKKLRKIGLDKPLIADIHFNPKIAIEAAKNINKIRINPGNFVDSKRFKELVYSEKEYFAELQKIKEISIPLIEICKKNKTAIRIGTNHGSLSERVICKFGNTTLALVEATFEFLEICKELDFFDVVASIKSSNPTVMVHANRLLANEMIKRNLIFPIHLGVTEAGNKNDGRIKSAVGIGALLLDGIGDTIRVSLTEKPENEISVSQKIINHVQKRKKQDILPEINTDFFNFYLYQRRNSFQIANIGGNKPPIVITDYCFDDENYGENIPDFVFLPNDSFGDNLTENINYIIPFSEWNENSKKIPIMKKDDYIKNKSKLTFCLIEINYIDLDDFLLNKIETEKNAVLIANTITNNTVGELRTFFAKLYNIKSTVPVIIKLKHSTTDFEDFIIQASVDSSVFLIDGLADGLWLVKENSQNEFKTVDTAFEILQATNRRIFKTDYISCPSCGRTLFDLEEVTEKVKQATKHLKGLKIAIMGCIVNGPGEVADADYGYIGAGNNKVTLFKGKIPVKKNIEEADAVNELISLIKENNDWFDK